VLVLRDTVLRVTRWMRTTTPGLRVFVLSRAAIWALALVALWLLHGSLNTERSRWDTARLHELGGFFDVWGRWDSDWFLRIAEHGYAWPSSTPAFFPLYPFLTGALGRLLFGQYLLAGLLISLVAGAAAFALLYRLAAGLLGAETGLWSVIYLALFPTSLFFGAVYSESLFLLLAVATFLAAERGRFGVAGTTAGLALLTRSAGIALLPALAVFAWRAPDRRRALGSLAVAAGLFALYPLMLWVWIGHPLAFLDAQKAIWQRHLSPLGPLGGVIAAVQDVAVLDLLVAGALIVLGVAAWRRLGAPYGLYALASVALPLTFVSDKIPLWSMQRFAVVVFPAFMVLAALAPSFRSRLALAAVLGALLAVDVVRWSLWYFVG
jgi:Mannosyltransferase (PIG-V)